MTRYIIARYTNSGFGDHLSCILGAWSYARATGRTLVVDWRGSRFKGTQHQNSFFEYFQCFGDLAGVPILSFEEIDLGVQARSIFPAKWSSERLNDTDHVPHNLDEICKINDLVATNKDRPEDIIVFNQHIAGLEAKSNIKECIQQLRLNSDISNRANEFLSNIVGNSSLIGIHLRHGNGENIGARSAYWLDPLDLIWQRTLDMQIDIHKTPVKRLMGRYRDNTARSLTATSRRSSTEVYLYSKVAKEIERFKTQPEFEKSRIFLCTDSLRVVEGLQETVGDIVTYPKQMLKSGAGPLHQIEYDEKKGKIIQLKTQLIDDMLIEFEILRQCAALICIPSQFNLINRIELPADRLALLRPPIINRIIGRLFRN